MTRLPITWIWLAVWIAAMWAMFGLIACEARGQEIEFLEVSATDSLVEPTPKTTYSFTFDSTGVGRVTIEDFDGCNTCTWRYRAKVARGDTLIDYGSSSWGTCTAKMCYRADWRKHETHLLQTTGLDYMDFGP